jgi:hypothetical protein
MKNKFKKIRTITQNQFNFGPAENRPKINIFSKGHILKTFPKKGKIPPKK